MNPEPSIELCSIVHALLGLYAHALYMCCQFDQLATDSVSKLAQLLQYIQYIHSSIC